MRMFFRIILKILLFPITLIISILISFLRFFVTFSQIILNIIAVIFFISGICLLCSKDIGVGISAIVLAWMMSPFGIPFIAMFIVEILNVFNQWLKAI